MSGLKIEELTPGFGAQIHGFCPDLPLDPETCFQLQELFDTRGVLVFHDLDIDHAYQLYLSRLLIRQADAADASQSDAAAAEDNFYISNKRRDSAAPFGRLQFHSDTMWAAGPFEVLSLYGLDVEQPAVPTQFVSAAYAWETLPEHLRQRVEGLSALHTAGEVRRGDLTDVLLTKVVNPPSTIAPIAFRHPRTRETLLYVCEQMTKEIVGLGPQESEQLLGELFAHLYDPDNRWQLPWHQHDLVIWDNLAMQHARANVQTDGPARTLRKVASPMPKLSLDEIPSFSVG